MCSVFLKLSLVLPRLTNMKRWSPSYSTIFLSFKIFILRWVLFTRTWSSSEANQFSYEWFHTQNRFDDMMTSLLLRLYSKFLHSFLWEKTRSKETSYSKILLTPWKRSNFVSPWPFLEDLIVYLLWSDNSGSYREITARKEVGWKWLTILSLFVFCFFYATVRAVFFATMFLSA